MPVFVVRHAKAGDRRAWAGPDDLRPLSEKGCRQADGLVAALAGRGIGRVVSSPSLRCVQTVAPLAGFLGLAVETDSALAEGSAPTAVVAAVRALAAATPVLCTHGDVIPALLDALIFSDGLVLSDPLRCAKGSTWVLEGDEQGGFVSAMYLPAPEGA